MSLQLSAKSQKLFELQRQPALKSKSRPARLRKINYPKIVAWALMRIVSYLKFVQLSYFTIFLQIHPAPHLQIISLKL